MIGTSRRCCRTAVLDGGSTGGRAGDRNRWEHVVAAVPGGAGPQMLSGLHRTPAPQARPAPPMTAASSAADCASMCHWPTYSSPSIAGGSRSWAWKVRPSKLPETVPCSESRCHGVTVGVGPSAQEIICIDAGTSKVPAASQSAGCYPGGKHDKKTPGISFSGADGFYFGRTARSSTTRRVRDR